MKYWARVSISALVIAVMMFGCNPAAVTDVPTAPEVTVTPMEPTASVVPPTATQTATATPQPTATPTPVPTVSPYDLLAENSLKYVAEWEQKADQIAQSLGYIDGVNESAENVCGPLSISQLRDAGWLPRSADPHDAWLLCARDEDGHCTGIQTLKDKFFPPEYYDYTRVTTSVRDYDWVNNPLKAGDWLYLYIIYRGFDHMITVTRVDDTGKAYTVTNINRGRGFEIHEELLYDPKDPTAGIFQELTYFPTRRKLGMTGTGGFLLVRRKDNAPGIPGMIGLDSALSKDYRWNALAQSADGSKLAYESLPNEVFKFNGMMTMPIVMTAMKTAEEEGITASALQTEIYQGRSLDNLITGAVSGETDALTILLAYTREYGSDRRLLDNWGLRMTYLDPPTTSAREITLLLAGLQRGDLLNAELTDYLIKKLTDYVASSEAPVFCQGAERCWFTKFAGQSADDKHQEAPPGGITGVAMVGGVDYTIVLVANPNRMITSPTADPAESIRAFWQAFPQISQ